MESLNDFDKRRKRGLKILLVNEALALASLYYYKLGGADWIFYICIGYFVFSTLLLMNRIFKTKPSDDSNYIFGERLGDKMKTTPQKFIYEVMMMSLSFIIVAGIASSIFSVFFTEISIVYKIIISISGVFGALFMLMILITTFQQYKQLIEAQDMLKVMEIAKSNVNTNPFRKNERRAK